MSYFFPTPCPRDANWLSPGAHVDTPDELCEPLLFCSVFCFTLSIEGQQGWGGGGIIAFQMKASLVLSVLLERVGGDWAKTFY